MKSLPDASVAFWVVRGPLMARCSARSASRRTCSLLLVGDGRDAERPDVRSHAERGNEGRSPRRGVRDRLLVTHAVGHLLAKARMDRPSLGQQLWRRPVPERGSPVNLGK